MFRRREGRGTDRSNETRMVKNLTNNTITLGDLDNVEIPPNRVVDLLRFASIQRIANSTDLVQAVRANLVRFRDRYQTPVSRAAITRAVIPAVLRDIQPVEVADPDTRTDVDIVVITGDYTALAINDLILCDASSNDIIVTLLPSPDDGENFHIKKIDSSDHIITVDGDGYDIDDNTECIITNQYDCMEIMFSSSTSAWWIV